jgi:ankyrin repeat protein
MMRNTMAATVLALIAVAFLNGCGGKTEDLNAKLFAAAEAGALKDVASLLDKGANVDATDDFDRTPLMIAALGGHQEIAASLIDAGAELNATAKYGQTALQFAREGGHEDVVTLLVNAGARG